MRKSPKLARSRSWLVSECWEGYTAHNGSGITRASGFRGEHPQSHGIWLCWTPSPARRLSICRSDTVGAAATWGFKHSKRIVTMNDIAQQNDRNAGTHACSCGCGHGMTRRGFLGNVGGATLLGGATLMLASQARADVQVPIAADRLPVGKPLRVQPVLTYDLPAAGREDELARLRRSADARSGAAGSGTDSSRSAAAGTVAGFSDRGAAVVDGRQQGRADAARWPWTAMCDWCMRPAAVWYTTWLEAASRSSCLCDIAPSRITCGTRSRTGDCCGATVTSSCSPT